MDYVGRFTDKDDRLWEQHQDGRVTEIKPVLCANCKHWDAWAPPAMSNAKCNYPGMSNWIWEDTDESGEIFTEHDFGCVKFEQRPE